MRFLMIGGLLSLSLLSLPARAAGTDDPLVASLWLDHLEQRKSGDNEGYALEGKAWVGHDLDKLWFEFEGEKEGDEKHVELQALYSKAVAPYWDLQLGLRQDFEPDPERSWAVIGLQGLAPYFFEVDASLFLGESGRSALRLEAEYELLFTQRLKLAPALKLDFYGQDDKERHLASGLANAEVGLRLKYEVRRQFAPYVGVNWERSFGETADLLEAEGEESSETQWVLGLKAWF